MLIDKLPSVAWVMVMARRKKPFIQLELPRPHHEFATCRQTCSWNTCDIQYDSVKYEDMNVQIS